MTSGKLKPAEFITPSLMATLFPRPVWDSFNPLLQDNHSFFPPFSMAFSMKSWGIAKNEPAEF